MARCRVSLSLSQISISAYTRTLKITKPNPRVSMGDLTERPERCGLSLYRAHGCGSRIRRTDHSVTINVNSTPAITAVYIASFPIQLTTDPVLFIIPLTISKIARSHESSASVI